MIVITLSDIIGLSVVALVVVVMIVIVVCMVIAEKVKDRRKACTCYGKKAEANAALIAAAPEMYEALADIAENCGNRGCSETCAEAGCKICKILKKARGKC